MADVRGKAQFFRVFKCAAEHEDEGDRFFARHAEWMERTYPTAGDKELLQYTVSKCADGAGNVLFLLTETYETQSGVENHIRLAHENESVLSLLTAFMATCDTVIGGSGDVVHTL